MSDLMPSAVLSMPFELAMSDELSRRQFYDRAQIVHAEMLRLKERERLCPTMQEAEARSLMRALQECAALLGLENSSPADLVAAIRALRGRVH